VRKLVLDTNILIHNPQLIYDFKDYDEIVISSVVLEELDGLKKEKGEKGRNAREATREILKILQSENNISENQKLLIYYNKETDETIKKQLNINKITSDDRILFDALKISRDCENMCFLTLDQIMYIKAVTLTDINAELYEENKRIFSYTGRITLYTKSIKQFFQDGMLSLNDVMIYNEKKQELRKVKKDDLVCNQFVTLLSPDGKQSALGYYDARRIVKLRFEKNRPYNVTPYNAGQTFLQEALMMSAEEAPLVICKGPAGTAKTFYSIAVGLEKMMDSSQKEYNKILCCRPNVQMDEDLGFLPGDEKDKIAPYFRPIIDNLEHFGRDVQDLITFAHINFEAVAFMRGRSIVDTFLIVDEAQNLTITQVKGLITRAAKGTKVVLIGDPDQIDNPYLDRVNNGLSYASERMKGSRLCFQLEMFENEGVRSKLATEAANRL